MLRINIINRRIFLALAIVAVLVPVVTYSTLSGPANTHSKPAGGPTSRLEVELITLRPVGCEPAELTRPKGPFVLMIDDRSGKENPSLVIQREVGERLRTVNVNRNKTEWHSAFDLPPGKYFLLDENDSERRCQITILP